MDYCATQTGVTDKVNTVDHGTFQDQINSYLQGTPDDVFTWFAGYRMRFFADQGLADSDQRRLGEDRRQLQRRLQDRLDRQRRQAVLRPVLQLPLGRHLPQERLRRRRATRSRPRSRSSRRSRTKMQPDGLVPVAFADKDGWPAMGTFDILNMRLNGYEFHVDLMAGTEKWTDPTVTAVFETWKDTPPVPPGRRPRPHLAGGRPGTDRRGRPGMYFLGTFAASSSSRPTRPTRADLDFFAFPTLGTEFDAELGIDAPIDGFMMAAKAPSEPRGRQGAPEVPRARARRRTPSWRQPEQRRRGQRRRHQRLHRRSRRSRPRSSPASGAIAQFLDRDTRPDFAGPNGMQGFLQNFLGRPRPGPGALPAGHPGLLGHPAAAVSQAPD